MEGGSTAVKRLPEPLHEAPFYALAPAAYSASVELSVGRRCRNWIILGPAWEWDCQLFPLESRMQSGWANRCGGRSPSKIRAFQANPAWKPVGRCGVGQVHSLVGSSRSVEPTLAHRRLRWPLDRVNRSHESRSSGRNCDPGPCNLSLKSA